MTTEPPEARELNADMLEGAAMAIEELGEKLDAISPELRAACLTGRFVSYVQRLRTQLASATTERDDYKWSHGIATNRIAELEGQLEPLKAQIQRVEALHSKLWNEGDEVDAMLAEKLKAALDDPTDGGTNG